MTAPAAAPGAPLPESRLKGLDGLRAVAALGVLFTHTAFVLPRFGADPAPRSALAGFAVTVFFALSGFLITSLLMLERESTGTISLGRFYARRALRILPLYLAYLVLNAALVRASGDPTPFSALLPHLLLIPNVAFVWGTPFPNTDHYWSLGVEEQFYLFWPVLVMWGGRRLLAWMVGFAAGFLVLKGLLHLGYGGYSEPYTFVYATRFDCLAIGGIGAWLFRHRPALARRLASRGAQAVAWGLLALAAVDRFHLLSIVDHEIMAAGTVVLILSLAFQDERPALLRLEAAPIRFLGRISYGLYVYHPAVLYALALGWVSLPERWMDVGAIFAAVFGVTTAVAYLSYRFVELPFLGWKERYRSITSSAAPTIVSESIPK